MGNKKIYKPISANNRGESFVNDESVEYLSPAAERRYSHMIQNIKEGKKITKTSSIDELLKLLD